MKKIIALILTLALVFTFAACSKSHSDSLGVRPDPTAPTLHSKPTKPVDTEPTEPLATAQATEPTDITEATKDTTPANYGDTLHLAETVFYDQDGIRAYVQEQDLSATFNNYTECLILVTIENSTDMDVIFTLSDDAVIIDNYQASAWLYETIKAGETADTELELYVDRLHLMNVSAPKNFTAEYMAYDTESYITITEGFGTFSSDAPNPGPAVLSSDSILFSDHGVTIANFGLYKDYGNDCTYYMEIQNQTGSEITLDMENLKINGQEISNYDYCFVYKDCIAVGTVDIFGSDLDEMGLDFDDITSMEFTISIYDDSYDDIAEVPISITFE